MSKLKITQGEWKTDPVTNGGLVVIRGRYRNQILPDEDAILIADAGNTYQKCGLLPSELLDKLNDLEALKGQYHTTMIEIIIGKLSGHGEYKFGNELQEIYDGLIFELSKLQQENQELMEALEDWNYQFANNVDVLKVKDGKEKEVANSIRKWIKSIENNKALTKEE